jgi:hypothetical protein
MTEFAPADDHVARIGYLDGRSQSGVRGGDEDVVQLDVPGALDPEPCILRHGRKGEMPDRDVFCVVQEQALDAYSRFPLDPERPRGTCRDDQLAPIHVAAKPDRAAAVAECRHCSRELLLVPNLDPRGLCFGTRWKHQHEQSERYEQTA